MVDAADLAPCHFSSPLSISEILRLQGGAEGMNRYITILNENKGDDLAARNLAHQYLTACSPFLALSIG